MLFNRILTTTCIIGFFGLVGFFIYADRIQRLSEAREQYEQYRLEFEELLAQQEYYESEINKLKNEDYIAMLARQKYFKSLPDEILFRFLEDSEHSNEY